ncbi:MAG: hypothetical protein RIC15_02495 [Vicingaceae bacterium]
MDLFSQRPLVIASMHKKESVIAPILSFRLGVQPFVPKSINTDLLGTFTGEIARVDDVFTTVRKKCLMAMEMTGCDLAVASEGSFGQHPQLFFSAADDEVLLLIDAKNGIEIVGRAISVNTNMNGDYVKSEDELRHFAEKAGFPAHALILRNEKNGKELMYKGIQKESDLINYYHKIEQKAGKVFVETDMRAMYNPSRMDVIADATLNLVENALMKCPKCNGPGFSPSKTLQGLPCELCGAPTKTAKAHLHECALCQYIEERSNQDKKYEDPMYCDFCNP